MKAKTFVILYWIAIILDCLAVELYWFAPDPNYDLNLMHVWFIGFICRLVIYILISLWGCIGLIELLKVYKIK
jgi:hypothetical protein